MKDSPRRASPPPSPRLRFLCRLHRHHRHYHYRIRLLCTSGASASSPAPAEDERALQVALGQRWLRRCSGSAACLCRHILLFLFLFFYFNAPSLLLSCRSATGTSSFAEPPCCACLHCFCLHCLFRGYYILMKLNYLLVAQFITSLLNSYRRMQRIEFTALSVGRLFKKAAFNFTCRNILLLLFFLRFKKSTFFICARLIQGLIFLSLGIILIPSSSSGVPCRVRIGSL